MEHSKQGGRQLCRRSSRQIMDLLEEFDHCEGLTAQDFCDQHNIPKGTFYNWRKRYKDRLPTAVKGRFVSVEVSQDALADKGACLFAEVKGIRLFQEVSPAYLKALLA